MTFISDSNKFIYIEIPKTGTASLNCLLKWKYSIKNLLVNKNRISGDNDRHVTGRHIKNKFPDRWEKYTTFCVVRNPWHRYISRLRWEHLSKHKNRNVDIKIHTIIRYTPSITDFIFDKDEVIVDKILKFENLQQEWNDFAPSIGLYPQELPWRNNLGTYDYHDYYNNELIDMVYEKEKKIIDMMNYTYD
jgi:hypothetical protein